MVGRGRLLLSGGQEMVGRATDDSEAKDGERFPSEPALGHPLGVSGVRRTRINATGAPFRVVPKDENREGNQTAEEGCMPSFDRGDPAEEPKGGQEDEGHDRKRADETKSSEKHETEQGLQRAEGKEESNGGGHNQRRENQRGPTKRDGGSLGHATGGAELFVANMAWSRSPTLRALITHPALPGTPLDRGDFSCVNLKSPL